MHDNTLKPNTHLAHSIKNKLRDQGILISTDGPYDNVLKTKPALCFTKENVDPDLAAHFTIIINRGLVYYGEEIDKVF